MVVATGNNAARIAMSVEKAAKGLIKGGHVTEGLLNKVEMAFRAYDPCLGCATHSLPGHLPLQRQHLRPPAQPGPPARPGVNWSVSTFGFQVSVSFGLRASAFGFEP